MARTLRRKTSVPNCSSDVFLSQDQTLQISNSASMTPDGSICSSKSSIGSHNTCQSPIYCCSTEGINTPVKKYLHTVHRQVDRHVNTLRPSNEEVLASMFLEKNSRLLYSYSQALISKSDYNSYHIRILLKFFKSRGKLTHLITNLSDIEIETTNYNNELFRGNSVFTRVFSEYLKNYCNEFLQLIISPIQEIIKEVKTKNQPSILTGDDSLNGLLLACTIKDVLEKMAVSITKNTCLLPPHLRYILRHIYNSVYLIRGEEASKHVLETLIFLRFILPPLAQTPQLLKKLQSLLKMANGKIFSRFSDDKHETLTTREETLFISSVNTFYRGIITGPLSFATSFKGVKRSEQDESYNDIVQVIRSEMNRISSVFGDGFETVFDIVKGKKDVVSVNVINAAEEMTSWMIDREYELEGENKELRLSVDCLKKECCILRQKVMELQTNELNSSN
ncbi:Ras GTPase-activating protein, putative [Entamoeba histolytica HM-3:IMSS]|uniref:Ras GTPase-activating protein, putative n=6 Tax=Entamoeba histolytica TaxID=5759 RepID=C4LWI1_ENTH1|nr:Ras GTPase-activating protein, putative [Entamoeba histolytica HM-1:IMSS]EMD44772.1 Ras GTPase-activating protein, putative [Entamoeba histolytica KU27]EMS14099.1 Ras GTPase-activating protein, putative [Entamoeba histolytica HM-3:IMSS]ENY62777.1 Ras GTPase-activating protein, putative [Entamoeba histolytica HM-1:IMSS-A]GAT93067.1 Ras GTPase-activating protein putative [Entamoeba histolytica]EAL51564.1 Ras GTPase-activating protein, putative [Entamoeba histolytica HM-1:IMSS]|eukprot:XP_656945.1 Ras GTPase-activating protein, putative [Entamoeba histolytica HM-1:IMSS]